MGCYLSKPSGAKPFIDSVSDPLEVRLLVNVPAVVP